MTVWEVGISDCESSSVTCICATKELAERELFKIRDELIKDWKIYHEQSKEQIKKWAKEQGKKPWKDELYAGMIKNLSTNDYSTWWQNFPHDTPWIQEVEVIEK